MSKLERGVLERIGIAGKYKQHILRQSHDVALFERDENLAIDSRVDYDLLPGMSHEVRQRLKAARPATLVSRFFVSSPLCDAYRTSTKD